MALFKKFILLPPLRSPESFEATYREPWPLVKKWPLVYLQTTKKAPKSISVARTDTRTDNVKTVYPPQTKFAGVPQTKFAGGINITSNCMFVSKSKERLPYQFDSACNSHLPGESRISPHWFPVHWSQFLPAEAGHHLWHYCQSL